MKRTKMFDFVLLCVLVAGCTYVSTTKVSISAQKVSYPMGISAIQMTNGQINIDRQMNAEGMR